MVDRLALLGPISQSIDNLTRRVRRLETLEDKVGGGGWPILTVASSEASAQAKADADWICDGDHDEVEIQAALDANHALGHESTVYLTEGWFYLGTSIIMYEKATLWGSGWDTVLVAHDDHVGDDFDYITDDPTELTNINIHVRDIRFHDYVGVAGKHRGIYYDAVKQSSIVNCCFTYLSGAGVYLDSLVYQTLNFHIRGCEFDSCGQELVNWKEGGLEIAEGTCNVYIVNCGFIDNYNVGVRLAGYSNLIQNCGFTNNGLGNEAADCLGDLYISADQNVITGNYFWYSYGHGVTINGVGGGLREDEVAQHNLVSCNHFDAMGDGDGIYMNSANRNSIVGNTIMACDHHGIRLAGSGHNVVCNNSVFESNSKLGAALTYDNINVDSNSDYNNIQGNMCRYVNAGTQQTRYGINIANVNCNGNLATNNDLYLSGVTASLNDAGTATVVAAGNRL